MTMLEKFIKLLTGYGMSESQANNVMELVIPEIDKLSGKYKITWNRSASEYPESVYRVLWIIVKKCALEWINENIPMAWFRPMFED